MKNNNINNNIGLKINKKYQNNKKFNLIVFVVVNIHMEINCNLLKLINIKNILNNEMIEKNYFFIFMISKFLNS